MRTRSAIWRWTRISIVTFLICFTMAGCKKKQLYEPGVEQISGVVNNMTELMVNDVTNPPLAARFFAYTMLAGYEVASKNDSSIHSFANRLNNLPPIPTPAIKGYSWQLAAIYAMLETAAALQPSGKLLNARIKDITDSCINSGMSTELADSSRAYGKAISKAILAYARNDQYRNISNFIRYSPVEKEGHWFPTPPGFFPAVEPYFNRVRSFTFDSASQFLPERPAVYAMQNTTPFYQLSKAVYDAQRSLNTEQKKIAAFWDCNPFALQDEGHLKIGVKKISPGAHWMGIAGIACTDKKLSFGKTIEVQTVLAITLMDAFLSCWDEKYRSDRIRPETAIHKLIDPDWKPFLQTPPFPEYPSGHSVISGAAATVLTHFLGDGVGFIDTTEMPYGAGKRTFTSFNQAADEAAISRFYGGIHYMDAINNGLQQGRKIGAHIIGRLL